MLLVLSAAGDLHAQTHSKKRVFSLVVGADQLSQKPAAQMNYYVRTGLGSLSGVTAVDPELALEQFRISDAQAICRGADELEAKGRLLYENLETDDSLKELSRALGAYWKCPAYIGDGATYIETLQYLGGVLILKGDRQQGLEMFRRAVLFSPLSRMSSQTFPPDMVAVYRQARAEIERLPKGAVNVVSTPPGAEIFVDGRFSGITPRTIDGLIAGDHFITLKRYGYLGEGARVDVIGAAAEPTQYKAQMSRTRHLDEYAQLEGSIDIEADRDTAGPAITGLARLTSTHMVLLGTARREGGDVRVKFNLFDTSVGTRVAWATYTFSMGSPTLAAEVNQALNTFMRDLPKSREAPAAVLAGAAAPARAGNAKAGAACSKDAECAGGLCKTGVCAQGAAVEEGRKFWQTWWFWTIIGGVAVAGGVTAGVLLSTGNAPAARPEGTLGFRY
jgi:hypothetical protein